MQCENCKFDLKQLACGHTTCSRCLEMAIDLMDILAGFRTPDWCPHCETNDLVKLGEMLEVKTRSIFKGVEQKKKELQMAAEKREQIIEGIVHIRCLVESMLRRKELLVMESLDEAYEQLQTMVSEDITKGEEELESIDRCKKTLPKIPSNTERFELLMSNESGTFDDSTGQTQDSFFEYYSLKLDPDEQFWQTLNKLLTLPMGRISLVVSNTDEDISDNSIWLDCQDWELPLDMTTEKTTESFHGLDSCKLKLKPGGLSLVNNFSADEEANIKSPFSSTNAVYGSESGKRRISSGVSINSKCSTPLTPPTSDSGLSSVFTFRGHENASETADDTEISKLRCRSFSPESPISASKFVRSASAKIRNFLQTLKRPSTRRKSAPEKKLLSYQMQSSLKKAGHLWSSPPNSNPDTRVVRRKKRSRAAEPGRLSLPILNTKVEVPSMPNCAELGILRPPNADTDCSLPEISITSVSDQPRKLIEFNCLTDGEQNCWLLDVVFLPNEKHIVVFDAINQNLKKFETLTGKLCSVLRLSSEKSNLSVLSSTCLAVTLPEAKQIGFISYSNQLTVSRKASTSKVYMGIATLAEDRLVCASNSLDSSIDIISLNCDILASFSRQNLYDDAPLFPTYLAATPEGKVFISDRIKRSLICLDVIDSCVDFSYYGREDLAVTWPAGVACDRQGNVYFADCFKTKMHRLSLAGDFDRLFMSETDDIQMCRAIDVSYNGKLVLTEYRRKTIKVYSL